MQINIFPDLTLFLPKARLFITAPARSQSKQSLTAFKSIFALSTFHLGAHTSTANGQSKCWQDRETWKDSEELTTNVASQLQVRQNSFVARGHSRSTTRYTYHPPAGSLSDADLEEEPKPMVAGDEISVIVTPQPLKPIVFGVVAVIALLFVAQPRLFTDTLLCLLLFMPYPPYLRFARWVLLLPLLGYDTVQGKLESALVFGILSTTTTIDWGYAWEVVDNHLVIMADGVIIKDLDEW